jgi:hypothetical protein
MANENFSAERLHYLLHYDPCTGEFRWLVNRGPNKTAGNLAGSPDEDGYLRIGIDRRRYRLHRLAWFYTHGVWPDGEIDHKDTDRANNRIENLRVVSRHVNMQNMRKSPKKASALPMGVTQSSAGFGAQIGLFGKRFRLGTFVSAHAAHEAYLEAKRRLHVGCTI